MLIKERIKYRIPHLKGFVKPSNFSQPFWFSNDPLSEVANSKQIKKLYKVFKEYGSDKSTVHDYHIPYSWILDQIPKNLPLLEVGIGTNNVNLVSNMGVNGKPGASLRAWKSLNQFSVVFGADIDRDCLFQEENLATYFVDQLQVKTLEALNSSVLKHGKGNPILIIDDGLHTLGANQLTLDALYPNLCSGGFYVIEDIQPENLIPLIKHSQNHSDLENIHVWGNRSKGNDNNLLILRKK